MSDAPMQDLEQEISRLIIETLNMEDVSPADINPAEPLFDSAEAGGGLGLDSIDALEIGIALQKKFGVKIKSQDKDLANTFFSVRTLAAYVARQNGAAA
jgi:acyl carrier protein